MEGQRVVRGKVVALHPAQDIARELRNPLCAALEAVDRLVEREGASLGAEARGDLDRVAALLRHSERMVSDLARIVRILWEPEEWSQVDLDEIVDRQVAALRRQVTLRQATISAEPLPTVWGQPRKLEHALSNLLDNAVNHLPKSGGRIRIGAKAEGSVATLCISDNGCGIARRHVCRLFDLYSKVPRTGGTGGTGVGLALVRRVVQDHGGHVWVQSEVGVGSDFFVLLPNIVEPANA